VAGEAEQAAADAKAEKARQTFEAFKNRIVEVLAEHRDGLHPRSIADRIEGLDNRRAPALCEEMERDGILERCSVATGGRKTPTEGAFRLPDNWDE